MGGAIATAADAAGIGQPAKDYFASTGSGGTLSFGAPAYMVISVIEVMS